MKEEIERAVKAAKFQRRRIDVLFGVGGLPSTYERIPVSAHVPREGGLAVTRTLDSSGRPVTSWTITHLRSGRFVAKSVASTLDDAKRACVILLQTRIDWDTDADRVVEQARATKARWQKITDLINLLHARQWEAAWNLAQEV